MVAGFSVKEWSSVAQIMTLTWLLGLDGFFHVLEQLLLEKSVDISRLKLLLSGDVEQNPGPMQVLILLYGQFHLTLPIESGLHKLTSQIKYRNTVIY